MLITWIDKKSVLYHNKRKFKAGDSIPAGVLSQNRIDMLLADKKIRLGEVKADKKVKESVIFGQSVKSQVINNVKVVETEQTEENGVKKLKPKKTKEQLEDEELQRLIDEEAMK